MTRDYSLYIKDILEAVQSIELFTADMDFDRFNADDKTKSAVVWKIGVIGEATKNVPTSIRNKYKDLPWNQMAKMRDKVSHFYFGIRYDIVWKVIKESLPLIKPLLEKLLNELIKEQENQISTPGEKGEQ